MVGQYTKRFREVCDVAAVNTEGIDANQMVAWRQSLRDRGLEAMRVQNRLCRQAIQDSSLAGAEPLLQGPTTLVWGADGIVAIAKILTEEAKDLSALEIRGGFSAGEVLSREQMEDLSKLPSREELIGQVVARALGQAARLVSLITAPASGLVAQMREIAKRGPDEAAADEAPAEAAAEGDSAEAPAAEAPAAEAPAEEAPAEQAPAEQAEAADAPETESESPEQPKDGSDAS
jgi:large subunit ribosomal protein L10